MPILNSKKIAVIGSGSWATALVKILQTNLDQLTWWVRSKETAHAIKHNAVNPHYLSSVEIDLNKVNIETNLLHVIKENDILIFAIPSAFLLDTTENIPFKALENKIIVSAIKGMLPVTHQIVSDYFIQTKKVDKNNIAVISGPCHAEEVAMERLSYLTIGAEKLSIAKTLQKYLSNRYIYCQTSNDLVGIEYAGVLKNIYAIASGITHGLGYGDNFQAVLVASAIKEMQILLNKILPNNTININDSVYTGDLLVTAYSQFSRNRTFGNMLGRGYSVTSAQMEMNMIAEGYYGVKGIMHICNIYNIHLPIAQAVYNIAHEHAPAQKEIKKILKKLG